MKTEQEKAEGCLIGLFVGDALGAGYEFQTKDKIKQMCPTGRPEMRIGIDGRTALGQITDDGEMALCLSRSIIDANGYDAGIALKYYKVWSKDMFCIGEATHSALNLNSPLKDSQANGALMRVAPIGIAYHSHPLEAAKWSKMAAALTHPNQIVHDCNAVFTYAVAAAISEDLSIELLREKIRDVAPSLCKTKEPLQWLDDADAENIADVFDPKHIGYVKIAFTNAFHQLFSARSFEYALSETVMRGGDTDTNAAIAGALLGAYYGIGNIPERWQEAVLNCKPVQNRDKYSTTDAKKIAKKLLSNINRIADAK
jgi:ADP-ribosylglycohydrolase